MKGRAIGGLLKDLVEAIVKCSRCDGDGVDPMDRTSACHYCGGSGERLDATAYISDIRAAVSKGRDVSEVSRNMYKVEGLRKRVGGDGETVS